ncbi:MAG: prolyl oligopeptidase family serine peptidase [Bacteroidales bacterium]
MMAANGYIVVAPNRRGNSGFGSYWREEISGDYGGLNMQDYLDAIDYMAKEPFVDENRLGAVGASYGGYSIFWLAGVHQGRFKALIAHAGMFNIESWYGSTGGVMVPQQGPGWCILGKTGAKRIQLFTTP